MARTCASEKQFLITRWWLPSGRLTDLDVIAFIVMARAGVPRRRDPPSWVKLMREDLICSYAAYLISISTRQWSLGPQSPGSLRALTRTCSAKPAEANTKSSWRVAVAGAW